MSLGFEMAGFKPIVAVDIDRKGMETYAANFPETQIIIADIRKLETKDLLKRAGISCGDIDVVIGGPPCQGFSVAGRVKIASLARSGVWKLKNHNPRYVDDPRNNLYLDFIRTVKELKPSVFVLENVHGMLSYMDGKVVRDIIRKFARAARLKRKQHLLVFIPQNF